MYAQVVGILAETGNVRIVYPNVQFVAGHGRKLD
jgi:hypothetical protein